MTWRAVTSTPHMHLHLFVQILPQASIISLWRAYLTELAAPSSVAWTSHFHWRVISQLVLLCIVVLHMRLYLQMRYNVIWMKWDHETGIPNLHSCKHGIRCSRSSVRPMFSSMNKLQFWAHAWLLVHTSHKVTDKMWPSSPNLSQLRYL